MKLLLAIVAVLSVPAFAQEDRPIRYFPTSLAPVAGEPCSAITSMALNWQTGDVVYCLAATTTPNAGVWTSLSVGSGAYTGTAPIVVTGHAISCLAASSSIAGCLSAANWSTFNAKQPAGAYITALTGDGTASGPGSAALTFATVNSGPGTCGDATHVCQQTVNAKGLVTATTEVAISATGCSPGGSNGQILVSDGAGGCTAKIPTISSNVITADLVGDVTGALTGNASTATALASNPTDCASNTFANAIAANGNLTCANPTPAAFGAAVAARSALTNASPGTATAAFSTTVDVLAYQVAEIPAFLFVATDFTTAANTSLQAITGLTFTIPASTALNIPFSCHFLYSQATAPAAVSFGIQDATVAPTSLMAKGQIYTNTSVFAAANLPALTTTTATAIVTGTPSAITTVWNADIDGLIEAPSDASSSVVSFMVKTATSGDAVTVKRGSFCRLN